MHKHPMAVESEGGPLEIDQVLLAVQAAAVAGEAARSAHDPVAGHDDADRVASIRQSNGPGGAGASNVLGELAVGQCLAVGNLSQGRPYGALEWGTGKSQGHVEIGSLPAEVLLQLLDRLRERGGIPGTEH